MSDLWYVRGGSNWVDYIDMDSFRFGADRLRNPAIVIPNRTRRWFHNWKPGVDLTDFCRMFEVVGEMSFGFWAAVPGQPQHVYLTGIFEAYGTCEEFPRTHGNYLGISREGWKPK